MLITQRFSVSHAIYAFAVLCLCCRTASAELVTFFGQDVSNADLTNSHAERNRFLARLDTYAEETMESLSGDDPILFGGTEFEATTDFDRIVSFLPLAVSGSKILLDQGPTEEAGPGIDDWIQFAQPVTAFGSYFAQGGDTLENLLILRLENTTLGTSKEVIVDSLGPNNPPNNIFFFGVIDSEPFNRVTMVEDIDFDGILLDNALVGFAAVPEPGSLELALCGAVSALAIGVRRRIASLRSTA